LIGWVGAAGAGMTAFFWAKPAKEIQRQARMTLNFLRLFIEGIVLRKKRRQLKDCPDMCASDAPHTYFFFLLLPGFSGWLPVTLANKVSNASLAVISFLRLLLPRYLCSLLQVRQRVRNTSSPTSETIAWSVVRLQLEQ
jgi:hypothetical protein